MLYIGEENWVRVYVIYKLRYWKLSHFQRLIHMKPFDTVFSCSAIRDKIDVGFEFLEIFSAFP